MSTKEAAIKGTQEIMWPVIAAVSTTAAAFCSHVDDAGYDGKIHAGIPDSCFIGFISFII